MISGASMKVSGWVRVWVVASLIVWGGGSFWLSRIDYKAWGGQMPSLIYDPARYSPNAWESDWKYWTEVSWRAGDLPLVLFGPFILGALMLGVSWIIRGFRPQPAKDGADANKPPPVGPA